MDFATIDIVVFIAYACLIVFLGLFVSREKKGHTKNASDYFLASRSLPWWAIGASLIASNISAEQIIGMSGSGYVLGLGIATYEWMAAATLLIVGKFFLPVFLDKGIYTMPQFLDLRYDHRVRTILAVFWLLVYVFVNLTSVMYLGAKAMDTIMGVPLWYGLIGLALFSALYSIYGGLKAVAWTDVVQVVFLIGGGLITTYLALEAVGGESGVMGGIKRLYENVPERFDMIFEKGMTMVADGKGGTKDAYIDLPGVSILIGAMWVINLYYWGFNQYITQRALAGKNLAEAQKGIVFAGYLKLFMPLIVVVPGIAAYVLVNEGMADGGAIQELMYKTDEAGQQIMANGEVLTDADKAYPALLNHFVPAGLKGLAVAALIAAIVSSLSSMINSTSTIFTMDLYRNYINKNASEKQLVTTGRITAAVALFIAILVAPGLKQFDQAFQFIQEFTGLVSPGIFVIFIFGLFWKKATANGAFYVALLTLPLSFGLRVAFPTDVLPFIDRMGLVFLLLAIVMMVGSMLDHKGVSIKFNRSSLIALGVMAVLIIADLVLQNYDYSWHDALRKTNLHLIFYCLLFAIIQLFRNVPDDDKGIDAPKSLFETKNSFNIGAISIVILLIILYYIFW